MILHNNLREHQKRSKTYRLVALGTLLWRFVRPMERWCRRGFCTMNKHKEEVVLVIWTNTKKKYTKNKNLTIWFLWRYVIHLVPHKWLVFVHQGTWRRICETYKIPLRTTTKIQISDDADYKGIIIYQRDSTTDQEEAKIPITIDQEEAKIPILKSVNHEQTGNYPNRFNPGSSRFEENKTHSITKDRAFASLKKMLAPEEKREQKKIRV